MVAKLSMAEAREQFTRLPEQFEKEPELTVQVTRHGRPVMAVLSWELYESITETLEILGDPELMAALRQSAQEIARGETIPWETVKAELGV
ncbi:MAG: type II toxin-antitoxin system Phd/YefM family antitoxin [Chloroflexota bacterium]|nr:type II toxin-antitoxin system Phd/YefM family antitoxin [Chloroflexota bacterium]MDQ6905620.1 type II toxin-antitoxin system Phd/YefM family antitoxin [Chloroflexota bacterium]